MKIEQITFLAYLVSAVVFAPAFAARWSGALKVSPGLVASLLRILALALCFRFVVINGMAVSLNAAILEGYPLQLSLALDFPRLGMLFVAEFCFLFAHFMGSMPKGKQGLPGFLILIAQLLLPLYVCSDNLMFTGSVQLLMSCVFYYLIRFSLAERNAEIGAMITKSFYALYFFLGLLLLFWGISEYGDRGLLLEKASASQLNLVLWMALLVLSVPVAPWARWLGLAVAHLPEAVTQALVIFLSAVTWKVSAMLYVAYPDLQPVFKLVIYLLGIFGCAFSIGGLFASQSRRNMLGSLPSFFFSLILVSLGVSQSKMLSSAYYVCLFLPVFTGLILYASAMSVRSAVEKSYVGVLLALILGLPGTPVYLIFGTIGSRSLEMGVAYTLIFALLWFFYFSANVHICRRIFMDPEPPETGVVSPLASASPMFTGFGILLSILIVILTFYAGRSF